MVQLRPSCSFLATLASGSFVVRVRLLWKYGFDWEHLLRVLLVVFFSFVTVPLRMLERLLFSRRIRAEKFAKPPVFIIGHWRSGTTFCHMLLCSDPQWGFVPCYQVVGSQFSEVFEIPVLNKLTQLLMPATRMFDNVALSPGSPQEDELCITGRLAYSPLHYFCFPKAVDDLLRYASFKDATPSEVERFRAAYHTVLQKASIASDHRPLMIKNPANTARVPLLLKMYPGAKFIHICREPYDLFRSIYHMHDVMTTFCSLHTVTHELLSNGAIKFFKAVGTQYLADRAQIPKGQLSEVQFEDLRKDPLTEVKRIYAELGIDGYEAALPHFKQFLSEQTEYKQNLFQPCEPETIRAINANWRFAFDEWGYTMRNEDGTPVTPTKQNVNSKR
eukprot:TRINITY_DN6387_c0_g1_i1.p1 TRINITY_DN6387_c0_g1~~TRINITY_DN6387_c0_g1_i1.p1  ORF type:complete len:389 (+),score=111.09 TRINITY_DN6387_c0_g1_i1:113-1279(+)